MTSVLWPFILIACGIGLIMLDMFVPSGGILSLFAALSIIAGVVIAFVDGLQSGTIALLASVMIVTIVVSLLVRWWPHTPIGRMILIPSPDKEGEVAEDVHGHLLGRHGVVRKQMIPNGQVLVDDRVYDAISQGTLIETGTSIVVAAVDGNRIVVRPLREGETGVVAEDRDVSLTDDLDDVIDDSSFEDPFA